MRKEERTDIWMLLAFFINDFTTEIARSITGQHFAVTPLESCDIMCRMCSVCGGCEGERKRERQRTNVKLMVGNIQ